MRDECLLRSQVSRTPFGVGQASMDEIADVTVGVSAGSMGVCLGHVA